MSFPAFFDEAPKITMYDPLSELLGATDDGLVEYKYADAVRLAGHSCPTVAGAWLMTAKALKALYPDSTPQRGDIVVTFPEDSTAGVTGVIANVVCLVTGSTEDTGFKGLAGMHDRRDLLKFNTPINGEICFTRRDTADSVTVSYSARSIPGHPNAMPLLQKVLNDQASPEETKQFAALWQDRVARIIQAADDPNVISITKH